MTTIEKPAFKQAMIKIASARSKGLMNHLKMVAEDLKDDGLVETARDYEAAAACINQLLKLLKD
jgi:hypothetical protein